MADDKAIAGYRPNHAKMPNGRVIAAFRPEWAPPPSPEPPERCGDPMVNFRIPWSRLEVGWDVAARAWARALHLSGADVRLPPSGKLVDEVARDVEHLAIPGKGFDVHVLSVSFATAAKLRPVVHNLSRWPGKRVCHTMFERRRFDPAIGPALNEVDGVWVPCSANREALEAAGAKNVRNFPVPHFDDDPLLTLPAPKEARTFYWVGSWSPHKSPDNLIRAFMRAFGPGESKLLIKRQYVHKSMPDPLAVIAEEVGHGTNGWTTASALDDVTVVSALLSQQEMVERVHAVGDVYVSASRGEGFEMSAYWAKLARRRVITTDSGGPRDFLGENDVLIPATGEVRVHPDYAVHGWETYSTYADYELSSLVAAMRRARYEPVRGDDWPREKFRASYVGTAIKEWLLSL